MDIYENIKRRRAELEYTLEELGKMVGVSRQTIQRYESGKIKGIPYEMIVKLSDALLVTPAYLMGWDELKKKESGVSNVFHLSKDNDEIIKKYPPEAIKEIEGFLDYIHHKYDIK